MGLIRILAFLSGVSVVFCGSSSSSSSSAPTSAAPAIARLPNQFIIGGFKPGDKALDFQRKWQPIFETYLTSKIGNLYNPPISFKLVATDYGDASTTADTLMRNGILDFVFTDRAYLVCLEGAQEVSPVATLRYVSDGKEASSVGSVIYSLKSNTDIQNVTDFVGKRIGVGHAWSSGSFQLAAELLLREHNFNIYKDASQVIFYGEEYTRQMEDVQRSNIDVAFVTTGWLEANHPDALPDLLFHTPRQATFQGEPFPFLTSTEVVPGYGLGAAKGVPWLLRERVYQALAELNASHPAAVAAGVSTFELPASYELPRDVAQRVGVMHPSPPNPVAAAASPSAHGRMECHAPWAGGGYVDLVSCPDGYFRDSDDSVQLGCYKMHLSCPSGLECLCKPCIQDMVLYLYPEKVVLGLCVCLFSVALALSVCWRLPLEGAHLLPAGRKHNDASLFARLSSKRKD